MLELNSSSEVILRHKKMFLNKQILFAGNVQDLLPVLIDSRKVRVHTVWFHHERLFKKELGPGGIVQFSLVPDATLINGCEVLIYYWPKTKAEAFFQLNHLLSHLQVGCDVLIVGENRSGVRCSEKWLAQWCSTINIDSARHCRLYHGRLITQTVFNLNDYWKEYDLDNIIIKTLPGVFSSDGLDNGTRLLLSTFTQSLNGDLADIGCGSGVLSAVLSKKNPGLNLTLTDAHAPALAASQYTLLVNGLQGKVLATDIYYPSIINHFFDIIISNPPFHQGMQIDSNMAKNLILGAWNHLRIGGELRIVAHSFLFDSTLIDRVFGNHKILAQKNGFKVYQAIRHHKCNASSYRKISDDGKNKGKKNHHFRIRNHNFPSYSYYKQIKKGD